MREPVFIRGFQYEGGSITTAYHDSGQFADLTFHGAHFGKAFIDYVYSLASRPCFSVLFDLVLECLAAVADGEGSRDKQPENLENPLLFPYS